MGWELEERILPFQVEKDEGKGAEEDLTLVEGVFGVDDEICGGGTGSVAVDVLGSARLGGQACPPGT